jgi:hypothetical protein
VKLFGLEVEKKQKGNEDEKEDDSAATQRHTTIRSRFEPIKHLPRLWTPLLSPTSSSLPQLELVERSDSLSEPLPLPSNHRHGDLDLDLDDRISLSSSK